MRERASEREREREGESERKVRVGVGKRESECFQLLVEHSIWCLERR